MLLSELCVDLQEQVCSYLSTRDLLSLSSCCWPEVGSSVLRARSGRDPGISLISRPAPYLTCRLELKELLASFLHDVGQYNPGLALLHIPAVFDLERTCDISTMFPPHTTVVKCMDSLLGSSKSLSRQELQALLFKTPAQEARLTFFLAREYENGSCKMFHIEDGEAEDIEGGERRVTRLLSGAGGGLCVNFELTNEMREKPNCFSSSALRAACGTNYVVHSHIPRQVFRSKARRIEGLQKIKKVQLTHQESD